MYLIKIFAVSWIPFKQEASRSLHRTLTKPAQNLGE